MDPGGRTRSLKTLKQLKERLLKGTESKHTSEEPTETTTNGRSLARTISRPLHWNGSDRKSVFLIPLRVMHLLRPHLYKLVGTPWPFDYVYHNGSTNLKYEERTENWEPSKMPTITLRDGVCSSDYCKQSQVPVENLPRVLKNVKTRTSQGVIYVCQCKVEDVDAIFIQKVNLVDKRERRLWLNNDHKVWLDVFPTPIVDPPNSVATPVPHPPEETRRLQIISAAFMDAMCNVLLSNLVEEQISPHFPLCYCTAVGSKEVTVTEDEKGRIASVSVDRQPLALKKGPQPQAHIPHERFTTRLDKEIIQVICLEYLPHSMFHVLKNEGDGEVWMSAFCQILCGLSVFQDRFDGVHNDFHVENARARVVPYHTQLWYRTEDGYDFCVPSMGFVFVMIDFGRACVRPWKKIRESVWALVSSEFGSQGALPNVAPDIKSFDVVRLVSSIETQLFRVEDDLTRNQLREFFPRRLQDHQRSRPPEGMERSHRDRGSHASAAGSSTTFVLP